LVAIQYFLPLHLAAVEKVLHTTQAHMLLAETVALVVVVVATRHTHPQALVLLVETTAVLALIQLALVAVAAAHLPQELHLQ
jgi:hypothetical protein